jgi:RNA polymerase sigma-70 factor (ECF subfamily)
MSPGPASKSPHRDPDLVARIRRGDASAFELMFRTFHEPLCAFAYRYLRSRDGAEDAVHDVLARIWAQRERLDVRGNLRTYLYTALRNEAVSQLRRQIVERRWRDRASSEPSDTATRNASNNAESQVERDELAAAVQRALDHLPERCRLALTLRLQRQMSYAEVADAMGISVKTVEIYIGRGLAALRANHESLLPHL